MSVEMQDFDFRTGQMHAQGARTPSMSPPKKRAKACELRAKKKAPQHRDALFLSETLGQQSREAFFNLPRYQVYGR
jgi:hypothetical protein